MSYPAQLSASQYHPPPPVQGTVNCPYCTLLLSFPAGASIIRCPACEQTSQLAVMPQLHVPCYRCHTLLSYFPHYALIQCPKCQLQMAPPAAQPIPSVPLTISPLPSYSYVIPPAPIRPQYGPTMVEMPPGDELKKPKEAMAGKAFQLSEKAPTAPLPSSASVTSQTSSSSSSSSSSSLHPPSSSYNPPPARLSTPATSSSSTSSSSSSSPSFSLSIAPTVLSSSSSSSSTKSAISSSSSSSPRRSSKEPKESLVKLLSDVRITSPPPTIHPSHSIEQKSSERKSNSVDLSDVNPIVGDYSHISSATPHKAAPTSSSAVGLLRTLRVEDGFRPLEEESSVAYSRYDERDGEGEGEGEVEERQRRRGLRVGGAALRSNVSAAVDDSSEYEPSVSRVHTYESSQIYRD